MDRPGYFALILHAHLPFVRHPEHERFLEESWLYEAITETYLPLIGLLEAWQRDRLNARLTLCLSPTLCNLLLDPLLQARYERRLNGLIELAEKETFRTKWEPAQHRLAVSYHARFQQLREIWRANERDIVGAFRRLQQEGRLEIITTAATHALLPLLADHPPSLRAQILTARDHYRRCFGDDPVGFWLPECGYAPAVEPVLQEANFHWFVVETHGLWNGTPRPRYGVFAPAFTPNGLAVFARDPDSAKQVWSREEGYPGDSQYRDFYRDIGFDLDLEYVEPYLPSPNLRGFTGLKYHRITGLTGDKAVYDESAARVKAEEHARHFLHARNEQVHRLGEIMDRPPILVAPYDAELFGHWWYEGFAFLDHFVRLFLQESPGLELVTPTDYLRQYSTNQVVRPVASSWGDEGFYGVWLNERNNWILPHLRVAGERMSTLARRHIHADDLETRALQQAAREVLLAQASDWPFILHTGTSPAYATRRVKGHLLRFLKLFNQISAGEIDPQGLAQMEQTDSLFPHVDYRHWF